MSQSTTLNMGTLHKTIIYYFFSADLSTRTMMWHKGEVLTSFEFRVFFLIDRLLYQG